MKEKKLKLLVNFHVCGKVFPRNAEFSKTQMIRPKICGKSVRFHNIFTPGN